MLIRLDEKCRIAMNERLKKRRNKFSRGGTRGKANVDRVDASNVRAVGALMEGFRARGKAIFGEKK